MVFGLAVTAGFTVVGEVFKALVNALDVVGGGEYGKFTAEGLRILSFDPSGIILLDAKVGGEDFTFVSEVWVTFNFFELEKVAKRVKKKEMVRVEVRDGEFWVGVFRVGKVVEEKDLPDDVREVWEKARGFKGIYTEAHLKVDVAAFRRIVKSAEARKLYEYVGFRVEEPRGDVVFFADEETFSRVEIGRGEIWVLVVEGRAKSAYWLRVFSPMLILGFSSVVDLNFKPGGVLQISYAHPHALVDFWLASAGDRPLKTLQAILEKPKPVRRLVWRLDGKKDVETFAGLLTAVDAARFAVEGFWMGAVGEDFWIFWSYDGKGFVSIPKYKFYEYHYPGEDVFGQVISARDFLNFLKDVEVLEYYLEELPGKPPSMVFVGSGVKIAPREFKVERVEREKRIPEVKGTPLFSISTKLLRDVVEDALVAEDQFMVFAVSPYEATVLGRNKIYYEASLPADTIKVLEEDVVAVHRYVMEALKVFLENVPADVVSLGKVDYSLYVESETRMGLLKAVVLQTAEEVKDAYAFYEEYRKPKPPPPPPIEMVKVRLVKDYHFGIVGPDLKVYGPFKEGEIVELPKSTAEELVAKGYASYELAPPPPPPPVAPPTISIEDLRRELPIPAEHKELFTKVVVGTYLGREIAFPTLARRLPGAVLQLHPSIDLKRDLITILHEFGHQVWDFILKDEQRRRFREIHAKQPMKACPTAEESFAEAYAWFYGNMKDRLKNEYPEIYAFMEELFAPPVAPPAVPEKVSREEFMRAFDEALFEWIPHFIELHKPGLSGNLRYEAPEFEAEYVAKLNMDFVLEKFKDAIAKKKEEEWEHYSRLYATSPTYAQRWFEKLSSDVVYYFSADIVKEAAKQLFEEAKAKARAPKPPVAPPPPEKRPLRELPEQVRELTESLESEAYASFLAAGLPREEWLKHRATVLSEIRDAVGAYEELPKFEAEEKIRERVSKFVSALIERVKAPPVPPAVPPAIPPAVPPTPVVGVEIVYEVRKPLTEKEAEEVLRELGVSSFNEALEKVLRGELPPEKVKAVYDALMKLREIRREY